jgi:hypothetical protein
MRILLGPGGYRFSWRNALMIKNEEAPSSTATVDHAEQTFFFTISFQTKPKM